MLKLGLRVSAFDNKCHETVELALQGLAKLCCEMNLHQYRDRGGEDMDMDMYDIRRDFSMESLAGLQSRLDESSTPFSVFDVALAAVDISQSSMLPSWDCLRLILMRVLSKHRLPRLWNIVASTILQSDRRMRLPAWLIEIGIEIDWVAVIKMLLNFDMVYEAADLIMDQIRLWPAKVCV